MAFFLKTPSMKKTRLTLKNGLTFSGHSPLWQKSQSYGEVVFTTGMTGYIETLTDPSFAEQMIVFTYPMIGNYGALPQKFWESKKIYASGVILSELAPFYHHKDAISSLETWLKHQNVAVISSVDTRALTKIIRTYGTVAGAITDETITPTEFIDINSCDLVSKVSCPRPVTYGHGEKKVIVVDCGIKENILRSLKKFPLTLKQVPYNYDYSDEDFDAVFLSNGPGDPSNCIETIHILQKALKKEKPTFGICLGAQLMALAIGAKTYKLTFGHRAQNQPTIHLKTKKCFLTSQNHGFAIDASSLPSDWEVIFQHLNDDSVQGIKHKTKPFFSVQFHPEACPGPLDTHYLFSSFYQLICKNYVEI